MSEYFVNRIIKPSILNAKAYHVPDQSGVIKLDAMENPYIWPDELKKKWLLCLKRAELNRYPDANNKILRKSLTGLFSVPPSLAMMFGNGSDELIQLILMALNDSSNVIMAPEPTFIMYRFLSEMFSLDFVGVPLNEDFSINLSAMLKAIEQKQPAVIFIARPNNPTGNMFDGHILETIINVTSGLVIIDEAYHVFTKDSMLDKIKNYPNVLLMRTLSKLGLAGLRLGILIGAPIWINELEKIRLPYNIGTLNQLTVDFICKYIHVLCQQAKRICYDRSIIYNELFNVPGIEVWPSDANFILFRVNDADHVFTELKNKKILIKNLNGTHFLLKNCLRVSVGSQEENNTFINVLKDIIN